MWSFKSVISAAAVLLFIAGVSAEERPSDRIRPSFTISRDTTHVTEPLTADGWPDYIGALNQRLAAGVTVDNNAAVLLYRALGPEPGGTELPARFFELLGIPRPADDGHYFVDFAAYLAASCRWGRRTRSTLPRWKI